MTNKRVEEYNLLKDDFENKKKNTSTARTSLSNNPENSWLVENLTTCLEAEARAKQVLDDCCPD